MERIAFIVGETFLYWSQLILAIAAFAAVCAFVGLHLLSGGKTVGTFLTVPLAIALSVLLGRLVHWYCRPDGYESFFTAMTDFSTGGYALVGVFAGCVIAVCLTRIVGAIDDLPKALDCMALAGALGICVGRLNHLFNSFDRGQMVSTIRSLPLVYPVENAITGEPEYRLATFMLQSIVAGTLFVVLTAFYLAGRAGKRVRSGDTCLLFMLFYGASQVVLDSTRYDSLFFRSNGFVSMVQIFGAVALAVPVVLFSVRLVKANRWRWWYLTFWVGIVGLLTCAGIMEYFVQRRGEQAAYYYNFMTASLAGVILITLVIWGLAVWAERKGALKGPVQEKKQL